MVAKKIYKKKKRNMRPYRRAMMKPKRSPSLNYLNVTRTWYGGSWTPSTQTVGGFWLYLGQTLGGMPSHTEFLTLFDAYKIRALKLVLRPRYDSFAGNDTTDTTLPGITNQGGTQVHVIIDPRSVNTTPTGTYSNSTLNSFLENGRVRSYTGNRPVTVFIKYPMIDNATSATTIGQRIRAPWLPIGNITQTHWGAHVFISDVNMTGNFGQTFDVFWTYYLSFKGTR